MRTDATPAETESANMIPSVIAEFYIWAEKSSRWEIEMYDWAKSLPRDLVDRDGVAMADKVPPPPPRWPSS